MHPEMERLEKCLAAVRSFTDFVPETALVLGSGLGGFADELRKVTEIPYAELPGFPVALKGDQAAYQRLSRVVQVRGFQEYAPGHEP